MSRHVLKRAIVELKAVNHGGKLDHAYDLERAAGLFHALLDAGIDYSISDVSEIAQEKDVGWSFGSARLQDIADIVQLSRSGAQRWHEKIQEWER